MAVPWILCFTLSISISMILLPGIFEDSTYIESSSGLEIYWNWNFFTNDSLTENTDVKKDWKVTPNKQKDNTLKQNDEELKKIKKDLQDTENILKTVDNILKHPDKSPIVDPISESQEEYFKIIGSTPVAYSTLPSISEILYLEGRVIKLLENDNYVTISANNDQEVIALDPDGSFDHKIHLSSILDKDMTIQLIFRGEVIDTIAYSPTSTAMDKTPESFNLFSSDTNF